MRPCRSGPHCARCRAGETLSSSRSADRSALELTHTAREPSPALEQERGGTDYSRVVTEHRPCHVDRAIGRELCALDGTLGGVAIERVVPLTDAPAEDDHLRCKGVDEARGRGLDRGRAPGEDGSGRRRAGFGGIEDGFGIRVAELRAGARERRSRG